MFTDDLSDYESSDEDIEKSLKDACGEEDSSDDSHQTAASTVVTKLARRRKNRNKYRKTISIKEQWNDYMSKNSSENNL